MKKFARHIAALSILGIATPWIMEASTEEITFSKGVNISHWLAQHPPGKYAHPSQFKEKDARWIARQGFDHIRIPIDGRLLLDIDGNLIGALLEPMDEAIEWAQQNRLGVILDMHYLPGNDFLVEPENNELWRSEELQARAANLWMRIAQRYAPIGERLRFELLNEAVAPDSEALNRLNRKLVEAIRRADAKRVLYVSSNKWGKFETAHGLHVFKDDPNIHYAFHYYWPHIFTHQKAPWMDIPVYYDEQVPFPARLTDLDRFPEGHWLRELNGQSLDRNSIREDFRKLAQWAEAHQAQVLITEFGVIDFADSQSTRNWIQAVVDSCGEFSFGWTVWDYKGSFAVKKKGRATAVLKGLFP